MTMICYCCRCDSDDSADRGHSSGNSLKLKSDSKFTENTSEKSLRLTMRSYGALERLRVEIGCPIHHGCGSHQKLRPPPVQKKTKCVRTYTAVRFSIRLWANPDRRVVRSSVRPLISGNLITGKAVQTNPTWPNSRPTHITQAVTVAQGLTT